MRALNGIQILAHMPNAHILYLSIRGVQGVNMINVMLMTVHALQRKQKQYIIQGMNITH